MNATPPGSGRIHFILPPYDDDNMATLTKLEAATNKDLANEITAEEGARILLSLSVSPTNPVRLRWDDLPWGLSEAMDAWHIVHFMSASANIVWAPNKAAEGLSALEQWLVNNEESVGETWTHLRPKEIIPYLLTFPDE